MTQKEINKLAYKIVACAIEVHKRLGPGLLESIYQKCFVAELRYNGLDVKEQYPIPLKYRDAFIGFDLKLDILVNDCIVVELKAVENMIPLYKAQLLSYLRLSGKPKGLLINFNCDNISSQMSSLVTDVFAQLPKE